MDNNENVKILSFEEWLEEMYGISWDYWDNNYGSVQQDEMVQEYYEYLDREGSAD